MTAGMQWLSVFKAAEGCTSEECFEGMVNADGKGVLIWFGRTDNNHWSGDRMNKKVWDLYAPVYERAMRADRKVYQYMYDRIPRVIAGKEVLEIATGPGLLAKHVAGAAKRMIAIDYSDGMIAEAKKGNHPANLTFEVADAAALPYETDSFDVVLIANALHVMPEPEKALSEIERVLRPGGVLIAPNFVAHKGTFVSRIWSGILQIVGISFEHQWSAEEYQAFLAQNGWRVTHSKEMQARIAIVYAECKRSMGGTQL